MPYNSAGTDIPLCLQSVAVTQVQREINPHGLKVSQCAHRPNARLARHAHANFTLVCVLQGSVFESAYGRTRQYKSGDIFFKPAAYIHSNRFGKSGFNALYLEVPTTVRVRLAEFAHLFRQEGMCTSNRLRAAAKQLSHALQLRDGLSHRDCPDADQLYAQAINLLRDVAETIEYENEDQDWLEDLRLLLHDSYEEPYSLTPLAARIGYNAAHVARQFQSRYGCSVGEYLRRLRIGQSLGLLVETNWPLAEIATAAGFADQAHFTRVLKQSTGKTPGSIRKARVSLWEAVDL